MDSYRPYAPPGSFIELLRKFRARNLPHTVNSSSLQATGISQATASRLVGALRFFSLVDEAGIPTDAFRELSRCTDDEYRVRLAKQIRKAYRDLFDEENPVTTSQAAIFEALKAFEPASQHHRMAVFFLGLCQEAAIPMVAAPRTRRVSSQARVEGTSSQRSSTVQSKVHLGVGQFKALAASLISGMIEVLPAPGSPMGDEQKAKWLEAMRLNLDLVYPGIESKSAYH